MTILAAAFAVSAHATTLTWIPGSTAKVEQKIGDCDYRAQARTGQCVPTTSQTATRARVLGTDIGASFESEGRVIFLSYTGLVNGQPAWSTFQADAVPVVLDNPLNMPNHTPGVRNLAASGLEHIA